MEALELSLIAGTDLSRIGSLVDQSQLLHSHIIKGPIIEVN